MGKLQVKFAIGSMYFKPLGNRFDSVARLNVHTFCFLTNGIFFPLIIRVVVAVVYFGFFTLQPALQNCRLGRKSTQMLLRKSKLTTAFRNMDL
jgi:hypothetical protein